MLSPRAKRNRLGGRARRPVAPTNFAARRMSLRYIAMIFRNGLLIFPDGVRDERELVAQEGKIIEVRPTRRTAESDKVDLGGNFLAPGFIDLHLHGALGRDTMEATREAFQIICDYHAGGGTTSLLLTTVTAPIPEIARVLQIVKDLAGQLRQVAGVHVEGPFISKT